MKYAQRGPTTVRRAGAVALVAALGTLACGQPEPPPPTPPDVSVAPPLRRDVTFYADFTGRTASVQRAEIRARATGFLERMNFVPGDFVKKGQLLFLIEPEPYQAQRDQAEASLKSAEANRDRAQSDLDRLEEAIRTNAVSQQDLDQAIARRKSAEADEIGSKAKLDRTELDYSYTLVRSPISGQVGRNLVDAGNLVGAGEYTLLTTVNKMDPIYVYFEAPENLVLEALRELRDLGMKGSDRSRHADTDMLKVGDPGTALSPEWLLEGVEVS